MGEQLVGPPDRVLEGLLASAGSPPAAPQQAEPVVEALADLLDRHGTGAGRSKVDRQRKTVQRFADRRDHRDRQCGGAARRRGAGEKQLDRGSVAAGTERRHRPRPLVVETEELPARGQHRDIGGGIEDLAHGIGGRVGRMLAVVHDQQAGPTGQVADRLGHRGRTRRRRWAGFSVPTRHSGGPTTECRLNSGGARPCWSRIRTGPTDPVHSDLPRRRLHLRAPLPTCPGRGPDPTPGPTPRRYPIVEFGAHDSCMRPSELAANPSRHRSLPGGRPRRPQFRWDTRDELLVAFAWIERTYHRRRRQTRLGRLTPIEFETIIRPAADQAA